MNGWVKLHRQIAENEIWLSEPFTKGQAWIDLFLNANHKEGITIIRGNVIKIKRGQLGWSEITMCKRWHWSKNKVRRFLKLLEMEKQIIQQKDRYITTIITILNYDKYQNDTAEDKAERQQKDSRRYINKNVKNDNNEKNNILIQPSADDLDSANLLKDLIKQNIPTFKDPDINKWALEINKISRIDGYTKDQIDYVIRWCQNNDFWQGNILSPQKLRKQFVQLIAQIKRDKNKITVIG